MGFHNIVKITKGNRSATIKGSIKDILKSSLFIPVLNFNNVVGNNEASNDDSLEEERKK